MKHQLFIICLLAIFLSFMACNGGNQNISTPMQELLHTDTPGVKSDTMTFSGLSQHVPVLVNKMEDSIIKAVAMLPTVMLRNAYMRDKTGGKRYLVYHLDHRPTTDSPYYIIRAVEDNGITYVTHFNFYYFIKDRKFMLYDTVTDSLVSLDPEEEERWASKNRSCKYVRKFSVEQRASKYPFSVAKTVRLISFRAHLRQYPFREGQVMEDSVIESKELSTQETQQLTDIIYNNFFYGRLNYGTVSQCFHPRNGIVFYSAAGVMEAYVLICFHCQNFRMSSDTFSFGDECADKTEKLRRFFIGMGVQFGTNIHQDYYPGEDDERVVSAGLSPAR